MGGDGLDATGVVIPTINPGSPSLRRALDSVKGAAEVTVVVDLPAGEVQGVRTIRTGGTRGFAHAAQAGVDSLDTPLVVLLNDDAWFEEGALGLLADAMAADPAVSGLAPKIRFAAWPEMINSVGIDLYRNGRADSRGLGQPDVGQLDRRSRVFGCHFAAAIVRRELFSPSRVGPLDEAFGMYFEDVDWSLRAGVLGYRFLTLPGAVAFHEHSATSRTKPFGRTYVQQERNLLWTALRSMEAPNAARIIVRRLAAHARTVVLGRPLGPGSRRIMSGFVRGAPGILRSRRALQSRRVTPDRELFALSTAGPVWFDQRQGPVLDPRCLLNALNLRGDLADLVDRMDRALRSGDEEGFAGLLAEAPSAATAYWERIKLAS